MQATATVLRCVPKQKMGAPGLHVGSREIKKGPGIAISVMKSIEAQRNLRQFVVKFVANGSMFSQLGSESRSAGHAIKHTCHTTLQPWT